MKTRLPILALLSMLCLFICSSCEKAPMPTAVKGCITEYGSGKALEGAVVYLTGGIGGPGGLIDSVVTDSEGFYYLESNLNPDYFDVFSTKEFYYPGESSIGVIKRKENTINLIMDPVGWIHYRVFNESGEGVLGWNSICPDMPSSISGGVDLEFTCPVRANREVLIGYGINNGVTNTTYSETPYVPAHDTLYYEIIF